MKTHISFCCILFFGLSASAQTPGGVSTNLQFWVKAGVGAGTVGSNSSQWNDQSGNGFNATQPTAAARPAISANQINFNQSLVFNGTSDYMDVASTLAVTGTSGYAIYYVMKQSGSGVQVFLGTQLAITVPISNDMQLYTTPGISPLVQDCFGTGAVLTGATNTQSGVPYIAGYERAGTATNQATLYLNGNLDKTGTVSQSLGTHNKRIGASYVNSPVAGPTYFVNGGIAEVIIYKAAMASSTARLSVLSYLGLKYGIPPPTGSGFIASTGTAFWTYDATYANNVFGIGRDDGSGLSQISSNSANIGSGNGVGQSGKGNVVLSNPSVLNNQNFIVLGNNSGALTEQATNLPTGTPAGVRRIGRQWKVNNNTASTTVNFSFTTTGLTLTGSTVSDFALLIDRDGDGNFATGVVTAVPATSYSGGIASFNAVNLPNNAIVTLVTDNAILLPLTFTSFTASLTAAQQVYLQWEIENEINVKKFVIQHSIDGSNYQAIGEQNFFPSSSYSFTDDNPIPGSNYYRIESLDEDGTILYSTVKVVQASNTGGLLIKLLNNQPGRDNPVLQFSTQAPLDLDIKISTIDGRIIGTLEKHVPAGTTQQAVSTSGLARGPYVIAIKGSGYNKHFLIMR